jgi:hypothetical protein
MTTQITRPCSTERSTTGNSTYKKLAVQWFIEALCFVSSLVVADSFRLRNRQLLVAAKRYRPGGTLCPECRRNKQLKESLEKSSSKSNDANQETKSQTVYVDRGPTADEIIAEAKAEKIEYELSKQKKQDSALTPWLFDENFSNTSRINSISYPNDVDDIEKTVERIIKAGVEQIKTTVNEHEMGVGDVQVGDKSFLKPFHEEFEFVEACFEKAQEGIKKLRRKDDLTAPTQKWRFSG